SSLGRANVRPPTRLRRRRRDKLQLIVVTPWRARTQARNPAARQTGLRAKSERRQRVWQRKGEAARVWRKPPRERGRLHSPETALSGSAGGESRPHAQREPTRGKRAARLSVTSSLGTVN